MGKTRRKRQRAKYLTPTPTRWTRIPSLIKKEKNENVIAIRPTSRPTNEKGRNRFGCLRISSPT
jgi:hypothetical protein